MFQIAFEWLHVVQHEILSEIEPMEKTRFKVLRICIFDPELSAAIEWPSESFYFKKEA